MAKMLCGLWCIIDGYAESLFTAPLLAIGQDDFESNAEITFRTAGAFDTVKVICAFNTLTSSATIISRKNGADGNIIFSIPATTTGDYEDTTHSDSISAGDEYNWKMDTGDTNSDHHLNFTGTVLFNANSNTVSFVPFAIISVFVADIYGVVYSTSASAAAVLYKCFTAGVLKNLSVNIFSNAMSVTTTLYSYINNTTGNLSVSVPSTTSGKFEDTANSDTIDNDDKVCVYYDSDAGGMAIMLGKIDLETTNNNGVFIYGQTLGT